MNKKFLQIIKYLIAIISIILFLEVLLRISDTNCYSFLPIYFEKEHSTLIKNESFCVKYTGHPKSIYKTNKYGIRINDKKNTKLDKINSEALENYLSNNEGKTFNSDTVKESVEYIKDSASTFGFTFIEIDPQILKPLEKILFELCKDFDVNIKNDYSGLARILSIII